MSKPLLRPNEPTDVVLTTLLDTPSVTLVNGETIEVPLLSWKQEKPALQILGKLLKIVQVTPLMAESLQSTKTEQIQTIVNIVSTFLASDTTGNLLTQLVSLILKKDADWVEENLNMEGIVMVLYPFLLTRITGLSTLITSKISPLTTQLTAQLQHKTQTS